MHIAFLFLILLQSQNPANVTSPGAPSIEKGVPLGSGQKIPLPTRNGNTTPNLTRESELIAHYEIGVDVGSQREAIGELKSKVSSLEEKREKLDRPDINGLISTRLHFIWFWSMLATVCVTVVTILWYFKSIIWSDIVRPRLKRELTDISSN